MIDPAILADSNRIKDRLRACRSRAEVDQVADEEREKVKAMAEDADTRALAIQIANLKAFMLQQV